MRILSRETGGGTIKISKYGMVHKRKRGKAKIQDIYTMRLMTVTTAR